MMLKEGVLVSYGFFFRIYFLYLIRKDGVEAYFEMILH